MPADPYVVTISVHRQDYPGTSRKTELVLSEKVIDKNPIFRSMFDKLEEDIVIAKRHQMKLPLQPGDGVHSEKE